MLVVRIELWPYGDSSRARTLAVGTITNTGTGSPTVGNYRVNLRDAAGRPWRNGSVEGFPRKRLLAWDLLYRALKNLLSDRNPGTADAALIPTNTERETKQQRSSSNDRPHPQP